MNDIIQSQLDRLESRQIAAAQTISELRAAVKALGDEVRARRASTRRHELLREFQFKEAAVLVDAIEEAFAATESNTIAREAVKGDGT